MRRATAAGVRFVNEAMKNADSLAVTTGTRLSVVQDFTSNPEELRTALKSPVCPTKRRPMSARWPGTRIRQTADAAMSLEVRLRALTTLCQTLAPIQQRKTVLYFASAMTCTAGAVPNRVRQRLRAIARTNVAIYTIDARACGRGGELVRRGWL